MNDAALAMVQSWIDDPGSDYWDTMANDGFVITCSKSPNDTRRQKLTITCLLGGQRRDHHKVGYG